MPLISGGGAGIRCQAHCAVLGSLVWYDYSRTAVFTSQKPSPLSANCLSQLSASVSDGEPVCRAGGVHLTSGPSSPFQPPPPSPGEHPAHHAVL